MNWDYYHILSMIRNHLQKYCDESDQEDTIGVAGVGEEICWKNQVIIQKLKMINTYQMNLRVQIQTNKTLH